MLVHAVDALQHLLVGDVERDLRVRTSIRRHFECGRVTVSAVKLVSLSGGLRLFHQSGSQLITLRLVVVFARPIALLDHSVDAAIVNRPAITE